MVNICNSEQHVVLMRILDARNRPSITPDMPLWKLKLTEEEYTNLKETLVQNAYRLEDFGIEAALCYAEWWRRDYNGGIPSREDVAVGLGLPHYCWEQLYKAARHGLKSHGFAFIHSLKGNEYFRTLLNQGGLPVNYIKNGTNLSGFSRFLIGLVEELSSINIDWDDNNIDLIKNFNCIAYLGKAFKNDNIYDVSLQIAHAIISEEDRWLPYDDTDSSLSELTKSLKREYRRVKSEHRTKPLSLSWKLRLTSSKTANLFVNLNIVKEISSKSIEGLNYQSCYTFDVFVSGILVGKYVRKSLVKDDKGEVIGAIYSRITVGVANDIKWSGEPVVEVKIRCDNDDRLFPTLCGSYPPNFECPQVFQMLDDNVYSLKSTANAENNIAVFSTNWKCDGSHNLLLNGELYSAIKFTDKVDLHNCMSNEDITITNEFTPYSAEFRGTYIQWVEQSNFKLLTRIPVISVFDQTGTRVGNIKPKYRVHNSKAEWRNLSNSCLLPFGLVDIKVEFPDNKYVMETFYFIDDMTFVSRNETMFSTELHLYSRHVISAKVDECENLSVEMTDKNTWRISRDACASKYSPTCNLKIIAENNPPLKVSVVAPFEGIVISDLEGKIVPSGKIISYDNLRYFNIISHGQSGMIDVTYKSDKIKDDNTIKHLKSPVIEGIVPLSDYRDLFARMFQLYGANTFDRSSSIELKICDKRIYIRKFVLDSELSSDKIRITDYTSEDTSDFIYDGDVYALPVSENIKPAELVQIKLEPYNRQMNLFTIPDELLNSEAILFSGPESSRRLVPKYYNFEQEDYSSEVRGEMSAANTILWSERLCKDDVFAGEYWAKTVKAFRIISEFNLPFTTYNAFKAIGCEPKLLVNLILACWINGASDVLIQEIDRFEDELNIAVHWIPHTVWGECIESFIRSLPPTLINIMNTKLGEITELINALFNATLSAEVASELTQYVAGGNIGNARIFSRADINQFKSKIHGCTDNNIDLPLTRFVLQNKYYVDQEMHKSYRVMIESAMCAAENFAQVKNRTNLFLLESRDYARIINFYRKYFKDLIDLEDMGNIEDVEQNEADGFSRFFFAIPKKACLRKNANRTYHIFNHRNGKIELVPEDNRSNKCFTSLKSEESIPVIYQSLRHSGDNHVLCPHCGNNLSEFKNLDYLRISATQIGRTLATLLLDNAEPIDSNDADVVYEGRKYITFTDSRQGSARSAMGLNQDVERSWIRASIFHKLADMRLNDVKPGGLTPDEEAEYNAYLSIREHLPTLLFEKFKRLEEKKNGTPVIPNPEEVSWGQISQSLENDSNFKKLYEHVDKARGRKNFKNATDYLKALLVDQFGWIPKRANSLETMGFVRLVYPALKNAKCPALIQKRCTDTDWQNFLKICMDYVIRGGRHYMLSGAYKDYLTQNKYCSPIYPSNSELRKNGSPVSKWFKVNVSSKGINENQNRLVLLLCAVLGYDDISQINQIKIADINSMLDAAWDFLRQNVLEATDVENQGYMLDLMGDKVKLQLIEKGYLCPVDNVIIDAPFCGYSPRMNGYIGRENFDRFKIKTEFVNPLFPFKSADQTEKNVMEWIEKNFFEQKAAGVFGVMNSRVFASKPIFISAEHSAQQSSEDLDRYEREFNEGKINILSCSTTMEMGVDIGGITEVVMNNVPPKSSNYLQRTGRAGRRNETKALALTVCAPNPIGTHTWNNPDYPITHVTETPLLKLESRQLIQRHVNAMVFASFVADQGGIRVTATLRDFFVTAEGMSFFDKFLNYIDSVISGKVERLQEPYSKLIKGTSLAQITLADAAQVVKKDIVAVYNVFDAHKGALAKAIESLKNESGTTNAIKAIEKQEENLLKTSMLSYLAENSFLPSAGLPLGLVECLLGGKEKVDGNSPTLHISQAISSYAPGNPVVKNEWVYEPNGIRLKTKYDDSTSRYIIQNCTHCGYTTIIYGSAKTDCPKCGRHGTMHGIKDISLSTDQRFTEVVEPAAFSVAWDSTPTRKMDSLGSMNFIQPILLEMDAWLLKTNSAKMSIRCSTPRSEILFYNKGTSGYGYAFCPYCGRMKSEKSPDSTERMLSHHKHLLASTSCPGGENDGAAVRRHVLLVGRYQTDFVEIKFYDKDNNLVEDTETLYSLGVILSRKLTELLGVNDGEIEFGYDGINHSIFIYDTALGGAGYSLLFREYKDEVLKMALETLERCDCERSCTKCLIDRRSQWYTNYLNRPKALEWLRQEVKARVAPKEIIYLMPDSHAVTSDITTEFYQLTRNKDISGIRIFVDDNISQWDAETFPFIKILTELSLEGVDVAFILPSVPDVKSLSSADSATLIAEVFKTNFKCLENTLPTGLFPLMVVIMNDGIVKTYFGKNIDTSYSKNWGSGDVFITTQPNSLSYADINRMQLLSAFSSDDSSFMFEYRIREHSSLGRFFDSLKVPETGNWNRIISNLRGKAVSIEYSDRYLKTPLGCMLLAKMISSLKNEADLVLVSIKVIVTNIVSINDSDVAVNAIKDFANGKKRNHFLKDAIFELTGIEPEIQDTGYVEHERCLTVKADNAEVCIRPDAGIAKGWAPFGRDNAECTDRDFREDWNIDLELFNKQQIGNGILYTISYKQL